MECPFEDKCQKDGRFDSREGKDFRLNVCIRDVYKLCAVYKGLTAINSEDDGPEDPYAKFFKED